MVKFPSLKGIIENKKPVKNPNEALLEHLKSLETPIKKDVSYQHEETDDEDTETEDADDIFLTLDDDDEIEPNKEFSFHEVTLLNDAFLPDPLSNYLIRDKRKNADIFDASSILYIGDKSLVKNQVGVTCIDYPSLEAKHNQNDCCNILINIIFNYMVTVLNSDNSINFIKIHSKIPCLNALLSRMEYSKVCYIRRYGIFLPSLES